MEIGRKVRVMSPDSEAASTAIVALVSEEEDSCDVIFDDQTEESCVRMSRISMLEPFECQSTDELNLLEPSILKDYGNVLFGKKDFVAASRFYRMSLSRIQHNQRFQVGSSVLVTASPTDFREVRSGIICDMEEMGRFEVSFDNEEYEDEWIDEVSRLERLAEEKYYELQLSLYLNLCRCAIKRNQPGWAVKWASFAIAVARLSQQAATVPESQSTANKKLADGLFLRGKAFLLAGRPQFSLLDAQLLSRYDVKRGEALEKEVQSFRASRMKSNRKLAVEVSKWVDEAMKQSAEIEKTRRGVGATDRDLALMDEEVELEGFSESMGKEAQETSGVVRSDSDNGGGDENSSCTVS